MAQRLIDAGRRRTTPDDAERVYLTPSVLTGKQMLHVSIDAETTERHHVAELWQELQAESRR